MKDANKRSGKLIRFSGRERSAVLFLLPLLIVAGVVIAVVSIPRNDVNFTKLVDTVSEHGDSHAGLGAKDEITQEAKLYEFDPNTVDLRGLCRLGFTKKEAAGILSYRERGKVFRTPADFAGCYQVSIDMYERLEPYINIGKAYRAAIITERERAAEHTEWGERKVRIKADTVFEFNPNELSVEGYRTLGFSKRQAEAIIKYRDMIGEFRDADEFSECYQVSPEMFSRLQPYLKFPEKQVAQTGNGTANQLADNQKIEINSADSVTLCLVRGIGALTAMRIVAYREKLGGFATERQLTEVQGMRESNYETILKEISIDISKIKKIDVNFATPKQLEKHPYLSGLTLRKLLKQRQLKGGWNTLEDMVEDKILSLEEAERLAPYLIFSPVRN